MSWLDDAERQRKERLRPQQEAAEEEQRRRRDLETPNRALFEALDAWVREDLAEVAVRTWGEYFLLFADRPTDWVGAKAFRWTAQEGSQPLAGHPLYVVIASGRPPAVQWSTGAGWRCIKVGEREALRSLLAEYYVHGPDDPWTSSDWERQGGSGR